MSEFMTVAEIADLLRVSKMGVYRLIHTGSLPHYKVGGSYRVARADFEKWRDTIKAGGIE